MYLAIYFWTILLILSLMFAAGNLILRYTGVILRIFMLGLLGQPKPFFSDSLLGPVITSTTLLYRLLLLFNVFLVYIGILAVFELLERDYAGRKLKKKT